MYVAAVVAAVGADWAKVPICPSRYRVRSSRYTSGLYLQEVELVNRVVIRDAAEED